MSRRAWVHMTDADITALMQQIQPDVDKVLEGIAGQVADEAIASTAFKDKTGRLRKSIRPKKSRYEGGGWIVQATAPHAHLVEYGHAQVTPDGKTVGHVPAHPFLRPAKEAVFARLAPILQWQ